MNDRLEVLRSCRGLLLPNIFVCLFCFNTNIPVLTAEKTSVQYCNAKSQTSPNNTRFNCQVKEEMAKAQVLSAPPPSSINPTHLNI